MHPSRAIGFEWDENNENHLARHGITPNEAEQVVLNGPAWMRNKKGRSGDWKAVGITDGGSALTIIVAVNSNDGVLRVITGWPATQGEVTRYL